MDVVSEDRVVRTSCHHTAWGRRLSHLFLVGNSWKEGERAWTWLKIVRLDVILEHEVVAGYLHLPGLFD